MFAIEIYLCDNIDTRKSSSDLQSNQLWGKIMSIWIMTARGWRPFASVAVNQNDSVGVFRPASYEEAIGETVRRASDFERDVKSYLKGELSKERIFRSFDVPVFGAFGEKL